MAGQRSAPVEPGGGGGWGGVGGAEFAARLSRTGGQASWCPHILKAQVCGFEGSWVGTMERRVVAVWMERSKAEGRCQHPLWLPGALREQPFTSPSGGSGLALCSPCLISCPFLHSPHTSCQCFPPVCAPAARPGVISHLLMMTVMTHPPGLSALSQVPILRRGAPRIDVL